MPEPFKILAELAQFGIERRLSLLDPALRDAFGSEINSNIDEALSNPILLHGQRAEAMFEALVVALGEYAILKAEDGSQVHCAERFKVPDFRVVLPDGEHWLIEVKNVYAKDPSDQRRLVMKRAYREALEAYAGATGAKLKLAVYWARWSTWTLISPDRLVDAGGDLVLEMTQAMIANELGRLGDRSIGTRAPLRLRLTADPERTSAIGEDGQVTITFEGSQLLCGDDVITDPIKKEIASIFMEHGGWQCDGPFALLEDGRLTAVEFR